MNTFSWLFMTSLIAPWMIIGAFGKGRQKDNFVDASMIQVLNWLALFSGMWLAGQIAIGVFPVIVGSVIQLVFIYVAVTKARLPW